MHQGYTLDILIFTMRLLVGGFFLLYRFRWFYEPSTATWFCPSRRAKLENAVEDCGFPPWTASYVAVLEVLCGLGLVTGFFTLGSAMILGVIMIYGQRCVVLPGVLKMRPVDTLDAMRCWLMWPEPLYLVMCIWIICAGPGRISLDYLFGRF